MDVLLVTHFFPLCPTKAAKITHTHTHAYTHFRSTLLFDGLKEAIKTTHILKLSSEE